MIHPYSNWDTLHKTEAEFDAMIVRAEAAISNAEAQLGKENVDTK